MARRRPDGQVKVIPRWMLYEHWGDRSDEVDALCEKLGLSWLTLLRVGGSLRVPEARVCLSEDELREMETWVIEPPDGEPAESVTSSR